MKTMNTKNIISMTAAALIGAAAGYSLPKQSPAPDRPAAEERKRAASAVEDKGAAASVDALRARIAELEKLLSSRKTAEAEVRVSSATTERPRRTESHSERMERMKKENPERYAQITNSIAYWRRRRSETARERIDFLSSVDTAQMTEEAKAVHGELQRLVAEREELEADLHREYLDDAQRRKIFEELRRTGARLHELNMKERDNLLCETARNLGFEGEDVSEIVTTVKEIIKATEGGWARGFGGGRSPRAR